jgi:hypothetical protein
MQVASPPPIGEWTISWAGMLSLAKPTKPTKLQEVPPTYPSKIIYVEEYFLDINKQMLETNYTLKFGQLINLIALDFKKYLW